MSVITRK